MRLGERSASTQRSNSPVSPGSGPAGSMSYPAPNLTRPHLALGNKPLAIQAWKPGTRRLRDVPGGLQPPQRGNFPGAPRHPSWRRAQALNPTSLTRLPRRRRERGRPGGGPSRQPAAGRPQAAAGERLPAGGAARRLEALAGGGGGGGGAGGAEPGARRERPGPAARRAGEPTGGRLSGPPLLRPLPGPPAAGRARAPPRAWEAERRFSQGEGEAVPRGRAGHRPSIFPDRADAPASQAASRREAGQGRDPAGPEVLAGCRGLSLLVTHPRPPSPPLPSLFYIFLPHRKFPLGNS